MDIEGVKLQIENILRTSDWTGRRTDPELVSLNRKKSAKLKEKEEIQSEQKTGKQSLSAEELKEIQEQINKALRHMNYRIKFYIHKPTGRTAAEIIDKETNEVIREIPEKELLDLAAKIQEVAENLFQEYV
jgi:flagellar protein FlaG